MLVAILYTFNKLKQQIMLILVFFLSTLIDVFLPNDDVLATFTENNLCSNDIKQLAMA